MTSGPPHPPGGTRPLVDAYEVEVSRLLIGGMIAVISIAFVAAGIAWPQAAGSLLRLMLATVALVYVAGRAWRSLMHVRTDPKQRSPFERIITKRQPPIVPQQVRRLAAQFGGAADARIMQQRPVPWPVRRTLVAEAARRLADHHGLDLDDPVHHARIRSLVTESTQLLILGAGIAAPAPARERSDEHTPAGARAKESGPDIPLSRLNEILDDLERL